jgi:hypothetical protein
MPRGFRGRSRFSSEPCAGRSALRWSTGGGSARCSVTMCWSSVAQRQVTRWWAGLWTQGTESRPGVCQVTGMHAFVPEKPGRDRDWSVKRKWAGRPGFGLGFTQRGSIAHRSACWCGAAVRSITSSGGINRSG